MPDEFVTRLLAGAPWRDRHRAPRPTDAARWFEPIHVREPARVRKALSAQVEAGADIVIAPTWLTHRRALMEIGESRRAAEWTKAAVQLAREAIEEGSARRGDARTGGAVLVAGPLPDLDAQPETGSGRLAERGAAADRDREAQAGILAEAGVNLILIERHLTVAAAAGAVAAAVATGLEVWAAMGADDAGEGEVGMEALATGGASTVLLEAPGLQAEAAAASEAFDVLVERSIRRDGRSIGALLPLGQPDVPSERLKRWLEAGVVVLGVSEGATTEALRPLREAIDAELDARRAAREAAQAPWRAWIAEGAERAPSGAALWLEDKVPASGSGAERRGMFPEGFAWTRADPTQIGRMPAGGYRFAVADADVDVRDLVRILEDGGVGVARLDSAELPRLEGAQIVDVRVDGTRTMITVRRDR